MDQAIIIQHILEGLHKAGRPAKAETKLVRLGLESLVIVEMLGELEEQVGKEIPIDLFWESETVEILAQRISQL
jgi:acyl carrier protein